jgi:hypothetical protein
LASYTVTSIADLSDPNDGQITLREALNLAEESAGHDTITFAQSLFINGAQEIVLTYDGDDDGSVADDLLISSDDLTIVGPGADQLTIRNRGLYIDSQSNVTIRGVTLSDGKGIYIDDSQLTLDGVRVVDNNVRGVWAKDSDLTVINSELSGNDGTWGGGIIFSDNWGGVPRHLQIFNSTLSDNEAAKGPGAINANFKPGGTFEIVNTTITDNRRGTVAAADGILLNGTATGTIHNSIIAGNGDVDADLRTGITLDPQNNLVGNEVSDKFPAIQKGFIADQNLAPLANNGGPTHTHALLPGSLAIDAGNSALSVDPTGNPLDFDQRGDGFERIYDDATVDVGAYEHIPTELVVSTLSDEVDDVHTPGQLSLREALYLAEESAGHDTITFAASLFDSGAQEIVLTYDGDDGGSVADSLHISSDNLTIFGPGADQLTIRNRGLNIDSQSEVTLSGVTFANGIGIEVDESQLTLDGVRVVDNTARAVYANDSDLTVINSEISGNDGYWAGGIIFTDDWGGVPRHLQIVNSTLSDNEAVKGPGAINANFKPGGTFEIVNTTITDNRRGTVAAADGILLNGTATGTIHNSIIAGNGDVDADLKIGITLDPQNNLIGNEVSDKFPASQTEFTAAELNLGPLTNNGGLTRTHALLPGSLAINAGDNELAVDPNGIPLDFDQRGEGFDRIYDDATVDVGAYELDEIVNDDEQSVTTISIYPVNAELDEGLSTCSMFSFVVERSGDLTQETIVDYEVLLGDAFPDDFDLPLNDSVIFASGVAVMPIFVGVKGDSDIESNENFSVAISGVSQIEGEIHVVNSVADGTIINDDIGVNFYATEPAGLEGDFGPRRLLFGLSRYGDLSGWTTVGYSVISGDTNDDDFIGGVPSGEVVFEPGQSTQIISIDVAGDTIDEDHEGFSLKLTNYYDSQGDHSVNLSVDASGKVIDELSGGIIDDDTLTPGDLGPINLFEDDEASIVDLRDLFGPDNLVPLNLEISNMTSPDGDAYDIIDAKIYDWALRLQPKENESGTVSITVSSSVDNSISQTLSVNIAAVNDTPHLLTQEEIDDNGANVQFEDGVTLEEDGDSTEIDLRKLFGDIDSDELTFTVERIDRSPDVPQPASEGDFFGDSITTPLESFTLIDGSDGVPGVVLELVPHEDDFGFEQLAITATDDHPTKPRSVSVTLWVKVEPTNDIPKPSTETLPTEFHRHYLDTSGANAHNNFQTRYLDLTQFFRDKEDGVYLEYDVVPHSGGPGPYKDTPEVGANGILHYTWNRKFTTELDPITACGEDRHSWSITATDSSGVKTDPIIWTHSFEYCEFISHDPGDTPDDAFQGSINLEVKVVEWFDDREEYPDPDNFSWLNHLPVNEGYAESNVAERDGEYGPFEDLTELSIVQDNELDRNLNHRFQNGSSKILPMRVDLRMHDTGPALVDETVTVQGTLTLNIPDGAIGWVPAGWVYLEQGEA